MPHRTFVGFIWPSVFVMLLFIALPILSVGVQSLFIQHEQVIETVENCGPFGCKQTQQINYEATEQLKKERPLGRFVGLQAYTNRNHLAFNEIMISWQTSNSFQEFFKNIMNLPFYKALVFTITYTAFVTPMVLILGFLVALSVNRLPSIFKGPTIFCSLLPFIVTPLIGALILFWMIDADGIIGGTLQIIFDNPDLSLKASPPLTWITLIIYGIWHSAPFSFIVFYAGLQTVPKETIESAKIDGANKWEQVRYVMIPHLMPLVIFIALMQIMDNFRVFEPIVGFNASANATSLSWLIYNDLRGTDGNMVFGSAAATSFLMIIGVCILLTPVLIRTWRSYQATS
tara:strand:- start:386 stop:1417 length:1032 start_codon:yes stop_codon:yes gene_type:complete